MAEEKMQAVIKKWATHGPAAQFITNGSESVLSSLETDVDKRCTGTGGTLLHLSIWQFEKSNAQISRRIIKYLIKECDANVNAADDYGRTPLTLFIAHGMHAWSSHPWYKNTSDPRFGVDILQLMLNRHGDPNVMYTPDYPRLAGCDKWRLIHECTYGEVRHYLLDEMRHMLEKVWNPILPDSSGRIAERGMTKDESIGKFFN